MFAKLQTNKNGLKIILQFIMIGNVMFYNTKVMVQYNLNGSNTDGSCTVDDLNSFFSPYKILPIAQENKYLIFFSYFIMELYVVFTY